MNSLSITKYKPAIILTLALTVFLTSCKPTIKSWKVSTLAGNGTDGYKNGTSKAAQFWFPAGVAVDSKGNVYVADRTNCRIRKITPGGVVITFAGSGRPGSANGAGTEAQFDHPEGVAVDSDGNIYVADTDNHRIRKITPAREVSTLAGNGTPGFANGVGTAAQFNHPTGVAVDSSGNVYVADTDNRIIRKITSAGVVSTFAGDGTEGSANGAGTAAQFSDPTGVAVDSSGNVYVVDSFNSLIRKITPAGVVSTLAGSTLGYHDATGEAAQFSLPSGVAVDSDGNLYVTDSFNNRIRKITSAGKVTTLAGSTQGHHDATGTEAQFNYPSGVVVDTFDNLYVAEYNNHSIRKITRERIQAPM